MPSLFRLDGGLKRDPAIQRWLDEQPDELRALAELWLTRIRRCGADVRELMHDGLATLCIGDSAFAYVGVFKAHVNVGFFNGASLRDPAKLLTGTGKAMRHVRLEPGASVDEAALGALIAEAYRDTGIRSIAD